MSDNAGERPVAAGDTEAGTAEEAGEPAQVLAGLEMVNLPHQDGARHVADDAKEPSVAEAPTSVQPAVDAVAAIWDDSPRPPEVRRAKPEAPPKPPRSPLVGLTWLIALSLLAAFFAWVSAEPFWLSVGHAQEGTVTVTSCKGDGATYRCAGAFVSHDGAVRIPYASITGDDGRDRLGEVIPAKAVDAGARTIYTGNTAGLFLRWGIGLILVLACALALTFASGAWRLTGSARRLAVTLSFCGPVVLAVGIIATAF